MPNNLDDEVWKALVEPRRRAILRLVAGGELTAGDIAAAFDVTRPAISQHLTVLRNVGLLHERREGSRRLYRTRPEALAGLRALLDELGAAGLRVTCDPALDERRGPATRNRRAPHGVDHGKDAEGDHETDRAAIAIVGAGPRGAGLLERLAASVPELLPAWAARCWTST